MLVELIFWHNYPTFIYFYLITKELRAKCDDRMRCSQHGPHNICLPDIGECVCEQGYVSANTSEDCLPGRKLHEACQDATQCYVFMGPGSTCDNGKCRCRVEYTLVTKKTTGNRYGITLEKVCKPFAGDYLQKLHTSEIRPFN